MVCLRIGENNVNDFVISIIRSTVPTLVTTFVVILANFGIELDNVAVAGLTSFLLSLCVGAYYTGVRLLAKRWPMLEWLIGWNKKPEYVEADKEA